MIEFTPEGRIGRRVLFTPGPLTTTRSVRDAMTMDIGSWDSDCIELVRDIREGLVKLAGGRDDLTCTLMQGSGSFGVESAIGSAVPRDGKILIVNNGAYGRRMLAMAQALRIENKELLYGEDQIPSAGDVDRALAQDPAITHVACVHCETTTGILNPLREIGLAVAKHGRRLIVDAISSFGAYPVGPGAAIDFEAGPIDHLIGSANKCIEGVPGFSFIISRRTAVEEAQGRGRSLCMDLNTQWNDLEKTGKFRYTPPTHVMLAFRQALRELEAEGGTAAREARYKDNHRALVEGLAALGIKSYIAAEHQSHIITTFLYPREDFNFNRFYERLRAMGFIIYPGKLTTVNTFRIGNIGSIDRTEINALVAAIGKIVAEML
ncbi:2-aminoethylphosphonate--pyruvate transaminase [Candidatus Sumerlaeota bacterium]|nr:2-aminoethylphosphonate--pyruvate transaminase [Candidatus Sumerlaeota bacterium]